MVRTVVFPVLWVSSDRYKLERPQGTRGYSITPISGLIYFPFRAHFKALRKPLIHLVRVMIQGIHIFINIIKDKFIVHLHIRGAFRRVWSVRFNMSLLVLPRKMKISAEPTSADAVPWRGVRLWAREPGRLAQRRWLLFVLRLTDV